jgi:hypothetical protein
MIFLGKERVITNWAQENLFFFIWLRTFQLRIFNPFHLFVSL